MAEHWSIPSLVHSWLPSETDNTPAIIRSIRAFIEERTTMPRTQGDQDVRQMKAIFAKMNYDDSPKDSPESANSTIDSVISGGSGGRDAYGSPGSGAKEERASPREHLAGWNAGQEQEQGHGQGQGRGQWEWSQSQGQHQR